MQLTYLTTIAAAILAASTSAAPTRDRAADQVEVRDVVGSSWSGSAQSPFSAHRREDTSDAESSLGGLARRALGVEKRQEFGSQRHFGAQRRAANACAARTSSSARASTSTRTSSSTRASTSTARTSSTARSSTSTRAATTSTRASSTSTRAASTSSTRASAAPAASVSSTARGIRTTKNRGGIVGGYYPSWVANTFPPENIYWPQFDYVAYAFATVGNNQVKIDNPALLRRFVAAARAGGTKSVLAIGGWGQSGGFSDAVLTDAARNTFATSINTVLNSYNLDGVDIDWEYPGNVQGGTSRGEDTRNLQTFLQLLRTRIGNKLMTAAVPQQVWQGSNGQPVGSVARAGGALDYLMLMNYDVWGSSSTPGPNAPLANFCGNSTQPVASAAGGVKAWTNADFPREKIILGVPSYGYINTSGRKTLRQRDLNGEMVERDEWPLKINEHQMHRRADRLTSMSGTSGSGQINFNALVSQGALRYDSNRQEYVQSGDWIKYWDDCSNTPYLANDQYVVTYDDPDSLYDKADFARLSGLAGVSMWSLDGDTTSRALFRSLIAGLAAS